MFNRTVVETWKVFKTLLLLPFDLQYLFINVLETPILFIRTRSSFSEPSGKEYVTGFFLSRKTTLDLETLNLMLLSCLSRVQLELQVLRATLRGKDYNLVLPAYTAIKDIFFQYFLLFFCLFSCLYRS